MSRVEDQEARRRSIVYPTHMTPSHQLPFQSGQHDPRLVASQPSLQDMQQQFSTAYMHLNSSGGIPSNTFSNGDATSSSPPSSSTAVQTQGTKRKRASDAATTTSSSSSSSPPSYPKMRLANGTAKVKVRGGQKAAAIEAVAIAEAALAASTSNPSPHNSDTEQQSPSNSNATLLTTGEPEYNPDGSINIQGMRLPPIMQVEKQLVTTTATQAASASRRRNEAQFHCPVPGCGSTFTRRFNLRGVFFFPHGSFFTSFTTVYSLSTIEPLF